MPVKASVIDRFLDFANARFNGICDGTGPGSRNVGPRQHLPRPLFAECAGRAQHVLQILAGLVAGDLIRPLEILDKNPVHSAFPELLRNAGLLAGLPPLGNSPVDAGEPVHPPPGVLEPVCIPLPTADQRLMIDIVAPPDVDERSPLENVESHSQDFSILFAVLWPALARTRSRQHLIERGEIANHVAAIVELGEATECDAHQFPDRVLADFLGFFLARIDRAPQDIVGLRIERAGQRTFRRRPPGHRLEILQINLQGGAGVLGGLPAFDRLVPDERQQMLHQRQLIRRMGKHIAPFVEHLKQPCQRSPRIGSRLRVPRIEVPRSQHAPRRPDDGLLDIASTDQVDEIERAVDDFGDAEEFRAAVQLLAPHGYDEEQVVWPVGVNAVDQRHDHVAAGRFDLRLENLLKLVDQQEQIRRAGDRAARQALVQLAQALLDKIEQRRNVDDIALKQDIPQPVPALVLKLCVKRIELAFQFEHHPENAHAAAAFLERIDRAPLPRRAIGIAGLGDGQDRHDELSKNGVEQLAHRIELRPELHHVPGADAVGDRCRAVELGNETGAHQRRLAGPGPAKHDNDIVLREQVAQIVDLRIAPVEQVRLDRPEAAQTGIGTDLQRGGLHAIGIVDAVPTGEEFPLGGHAAVLAKCRAVVHSTRCSGWRRAKTSAASRNRSTLAGSGT